ncbi:hypothetical protein BC828DRAFT_64416 [Blastocladiella britannica]|nr:hypothetical protein BC828DRAFT_64416 [Blastocladiella britannica]
MTTINRVFLINKPILLRSPVLVRHLHWRTFSMAGATSSASNNSDAASNESDAELFVRLLFLPIIDRGGSTSNSPNPPQGTDYDQVRRTPPHPRPVERDPSSPPAKKTPTEDTFDHPEDLMAGCTGSAGQGWDETKGWLLLMPLRRWRLPSLTLQPLALQQHRGYSTNTDKIEQHQMQEQQEEDLSSSSAGQWENHNPDNDEYDPMSGGDGASRISVDVGHEGYKGYKGYGNAA